MKTFANFLAQTGFAAAVTCLLTLSSVQLHAATGYELLADSLDSSEVNKSVIDCEPLGKAVAKAVAAHKKSAPEIVGAAILKTNDCVCRREIVEKAILALGNYKDLDKNLIPNLVAAAIRSSAAGINKAGYDGCVCAPELTKAAILILGKDPSEDLVIAIVKASVGAAGSDCANRIVEAASQASPQNASGITDAGAAGTTEPGAPDGLVYTPTGSVNAPGAFFPPSAPNNGITNPTTPVN